MLMTREQQRNLENLHEAIAKKMHEHYTAACGVVADVDIAYVDQTTYGEFVASLSRPSASYTFEVEVLGEGTVVLDYSLPIAYSLLEYAGVDKPDGQMEARHRESLAERFKQDLADIESVWAAVTAFTGSNAQFETNPDCLGAGQDNDHVALIAFDVHLPHASGKISLCYPIAALDAVLPMLEAVA